MSGPDYTSTGGGALKLKGTGVEKRKRKKKPKPVGDDTAILKDVQANPSDNAQNALAEEDGKDGEAEASASIELSEDLKRDLVEYKGKTEAERRHEDRRRQRLHERLKREGVKTHKERVEELNRYLSAQSEHHDMPKIGPG